MNSNDTRPEVVEPEIVPVTRMNAVRFDMRSTVQSPFFWFVLGAGAASLGIWLIHKEGRRNSS